MKNEGENDLSKDIDGVEHQLWHLVEDVRQLTNQLDLMCKLFSHIYRDKIPNSWIHIYKLDAKDIKEELNAKDIKEELNVKDINEKLDLEDPVVYEMAKVFLAILKKLKQ